MLGCLDQVALPTKTGLNNPNQLKLGSQGGLCLLPETCGILSPREFRMLHGGSSSVIGPIVRGRLSRLPSPLGGRTPVGLFRLWDFGGLAICR